MPNDKFIPTRLNTPRDTFGDSVRFQNMAKGQRRKTPGIPEDIDMRLRLQALMQNFMSIRDAIDQKDIAKMADKLADAIEMAHSMAICCGIDLRPIQEAIHRANMEAKAPPGIAMFNALGHRHADVVRKAPDVAAILAKQKPIPEVD